VAPQAYTLPAAEVVHRRRAGIVNGLLALLFFASGFAAILYQLVWQRMLFALVGINVEAVTLIVTIFIAGLGLGSLVGGHASRLPTERLITAFALVELGIGLFGAASPAVFALFGEWAPRLTPLQVALGTAVLILPPTMAMGATLPILVAHAVRRNPNVGEAVGTLYGVNTLGSACAGFAAGYGVMRAFGQSGAIALGAGCNVTVALIALLVLRKTAR
jgi:predicted membrane-bound spermidine synthase